MPVVSDRIKSRSYLTVDEWNGVCSELLSNLTAEESEALFDVLADEKMVSVLSATEYDEEPVGIEEWLQDEFHMGGVTRNLYPRWRNDLVELFSTSQYNVALFLGSLGSGKSEVASIAIIRMLYEASCLRNPAVSYGLNPGSKIGFCVMAPSEQVARAAIFEKIVTKIQMIPYFQMKFPPLQRMKDNRTFRGSTLDFRKDLFIVCGSSNDTASLGANIMGGFIDELNFFRKNKKTLSSTANRWGEYNKAGQLFEGLMRRMKSRFMNRGKLPGLLIGASSKESVDALTQRFVRQAIQSGDSSFFVRDRSVIELKKDFFSKKTFRVLVGNENYRSRILEPDEDPKELDPDAVAVEVPEDLRNDFEMDLEAALRDIAGIATLAISNFIQKVERIHSCKDETRRHPFSCVLMEDSGQWDSRLPYQVKWHELAQQQDNGEWIPRLNPHAKRFVHLDPALTGDAFGLCIAHVSGFIELRRQGQEGEIVEYQPTFCVDFILRIQGQVGEEVIFRNVRRLLYDFSEHGFHLSLVSMDTYQSREMQQQLEVQGYKTKILSVDESKEPYYYLRRAIYEGRIKCYDYEILWDELRKLENTPTKVDHPDGAGKDLADALCGVVWELGQESWEAPIMPQQGISEYVGGAEVRDALQFERQVQPDVPVVPDVPISAQVAASPSSVQVYRKKPVASVLPQYRKVDSMGKDRVGGTESRILDTIEIG